MLTPQSPSTSNAQQPQAALTSTVRKEVQAVIDALPDSSLHYLKPYLEFLMQQQRAAAISKRAAKVVSNDSMREDLGV